MSYDILDEATFRGWCALHHAKHDDPEQRTYYENYVWKHDAWVTAKAILAYAAEIARADEFKSPADVHERAFNRACMCIAAKLSGDPS